MSGDRGLAPAAILLLAVALTVVAYGRVVVAGPLAAVALGLLLVGRRLRRGRTDDSDWVAPAEMTRGRRDANRGSAALALAPAEARELLLSPWFAAGVGFCVLLGAIAAGSFERSWWGSAGLMPLLVHPMCGLTIVAVHRNVSRARRDGSNELFRACPVTSRQRHAAHLLAGVVPVAVGVGFVVTTLAGAALVLDHIYGPVDERVVADAVLAGVLLPLGAVALGVLLGRRAPFALAPFVAVAAVALVNLEFWDDVPAGRGWLASGLPSDGVDLVYHAPPTVGRLVWFLGLVLVISGFALADGRRSRGTSVSMLGLVVAVTGVVVTTRPLSDATAERLAAYVVDPGRYESCRRLTTDVDVCALEPYREHGAQLAARMQPVASAIPEGVLATPLTLRLLVGENLEALPDEVQDRIVPTPIPPGTVALPFSHRSSGLDEARFILAAAAVGLPTGTEAPANVLVDGQARGIVLLWLATAGERAQDARELLEPDRYNPRSAAGRGEVWPGDCQADVQWAPQDITAARRVIELDRGAVATVLADDWSRWTDASVHTNELLGVLGLEPVGPYDEIEPLGKTC